MRIEKFEGLAVAINDEIAIWFNRCFVRHYSGDCDANEGNIEWAFLGANEGDKHWSMYGKEDFEAAHPGVLDDILRRLNENG